MGFLCFFNKEQKPVSFYKNNKLGFKKPGGLD